MEDPRFTPGRPGAEKGFYGITSYTPEGPTHQLSDAQAAYLAGIKGYTGTPEQQQALAQWRAREQQAFDARNAESAYARIQNPDAMAPNQSTNYLARSADGSRTVAYAADPDRLSDAAFRFQGFGKQLSDLNQYTAQSARQLGQAYQNTQQTRGAMLSAIQNGGAAEADAAARQAMSIARSGRGMGAAGALRAGMQQGAETGAQLRAQGMQQRAGQLAQLGQLDANAMGMANQGVLSGFQQRSALTQAQQQAQADQAKTQMAADVGVDLQNAQFANYRDPPKDNSGAVAGAIASGLGAAATMISDIRAKKDVKPISGGDFASLASKMRAGGGRDLSSDPMGKMGERALTGVGPAAQALASGIAYDANAYNSQPVLIPPMLKPLELSDANSKEEIRRLTRERDEWMTAAMGNAGEDIGRKVQRDNPAMAEDMARMQRTGREPVSDQAASLASLAQTPGYSYRYKEGEGEDPNRRHVGPMAQDLERTPVGESVIQTMPDGRKAIDTGRLSLVNSTATGELARRLANLENAVAPQPVREPRNPARDLALRRGTRLSDLAGY